MALSVRVNVLPVVETEYDKRLGAVVTVEIPATATIEVLTRKFGRLVAETELKGFDYNENMVPSLFVVGPTQATAVQTATSVPTVCGLVLRRENYLRATHTVGACWPAAVRAATTPSDGIHAVTLVVCPALSTRFLLRWNQSFVAGRRNLETLFDNSITDKTLVVPALQNTPIYVRDCYDRMYSVICEQLGLFSSAPTQENRYELRSKRQKPTPRQDDDVVLVMGTSGSGLTTFLWYLLYKLVATHTVVLDFPRWSYFVLVRRDGSILNGDRRHHFQAELQDPETVYLVELETKHDVLDSRPPRAKQIVVANADRGIRDRLRGGERQTMLFMPLWSLQELQECRQRCYSYLDTTDDELATLIKFYGGVPLWLLFFDHGVGRGDPIQAAIQALETEVDLLDEKDLQIMKACVGKSPIHGSLLSRLERMLVHVVAARDFRSATVEFASEFVKNAVSKKRKEVEERIYVRG